jgi:hypothetical protein
VGVEAGYLVRYAAGLAAGGAVALAVLALTSAAVAAVAGATAFAAFAFVLRLVPSELTALMPRR